jgi:hypothetical protein
MSPTTVQLDWSHVTGTTAYTVYRRAANSSAPEIISKITSGYFFRTNFVDGSFTPGITYSYYVQSDKGERSAEVTPLRLSTLAAPQLTAKLTSKISAELSWNPIPGAVSYTLFSRNKDGGKDEGMYAGTETRYETDVKTDVPFYYYVIAYGADDRPSPESNEVVTLGSSYVPPSQITVTGMDSTRIRPGNAFKFRYSIKSAYLDTNSYYPYKGNFRIERLIINPRGTTIVRASAIWNPKYGDTFTSTPTVVSNSGWMKGGYKMVINVYALQEKGRFIDSKTVGFKVE